MNKLAFLIALLLIASCKNSEEKVDPTLIATNVAWEHSYQAISKLGDTLKSLPTSEKTLQDYAVKRETYIGNPHTLDNLIWYGRFAAYSGDYRKAIEIYSEGLEKFPNESRLLRHRGHRYISVREFDMAIADLTEAARLIEGKENMIEEDGMPNAQNIPVSTMHGNIFYHLGLAHYLNGNMQAAVEAYQKCLATANNPDNVVSSTHWLYMITRRMGLEEEANTYLEAINTDMNVIENDSYHKACLFYKGLLDLKDVYDPESENSPSNSALKYGVGNWYLYNDQPDQALGIFNNIVSGTDWASFGFIAAEVDLATQ